MGHNKSQEEFLKSLNDEEYGSALNARRALGQSDDIIKDQASWEVAEAAVAAHFQTVVRKWLPVLERIKYYSSRSKEDGSWNYSEQECIDLCKSYGFKVTRKQVREVRTQIKGHKAPRRYTRKAKPVEKPNGHHQSNGEHKMGPKLMDKVLQSGFGLSDLAPLYRELRQFFEDSAKLV